MNLSGLRLTSLFLPETKVVGSIYRSPGSSNTEFCNKLEAILNCLTYKNKNIFITGDVNINIIDFFDSSCSEYIDCVLGYGLQLLINLPTRSPGHGPGTVIESPHEITPKIFRHKPLKK